MIWTHIIFIKKFKFINLKRKNVSPETKFLWKFQDLCRKVPSLNWNEPRCPNILFRNSFRFHPLSKKIFQLLVPSFKFIFLNKLLKRLEGLDSFSWFQYGQTRSFNDELIKDKFYVTDRNPCIFMTQPPTTIATHKNSIVFIEGLIKSKHMKVDLLRCSLENKIPLIIYDYSYDILKQKMAKTENSEFYIQRHLNFLFW